MQTSKQKAEHLKGDGEISREQTALVNQSQAPALSRAVVV